jgi:hypothetical protein
VVEATDVGINEAAVAVERFVTGYTGAGGRKPVEVQVHPSGDDMNAIKVWVNLGGDAEGDDRSAWCTAAEAAIRAALGADLGTWALDVRADAF